MTVSLPIRSPASRLCVLVFVCLCRPVCRLTTGKNWPQPPPATFVFVRVVPNCDLSRRRGLHQLSGSVLNDVSIKFVQVTRTNCFDSCDRVSQDFFFFVSSLTLLGTQSRLGDNSLGIRLVCPQIGAAVLKGLTASFASATFSYVCESLRVAYCSVFACAPCADCIFRRVYSRVCICMPLFVFTIIGRDVTDRRIARPVSLLEVRVFSLP